MFEKLKNSKKGEKTLFATMLPGFVPLLRRGFNELYMTLTVSNRCVEDAQAERGKARSATSARSRSKKC
jgi:hypothetical protein